ncbi:hypothetical protein MJG53_016711 [Ovis ammon polii x Ovis aries]|uniref:Uncharacterized protein n=1 Tax=Ovis ammon polii x Ovis aries TaxID=2918886 RepID=A0ACB9U943_9CETA|nr:hypothetical protein MJG53_016711 [Ovis ammon polii x Ovis aries]
MMSLGSTRFFKVAPVKHQEGPVVVKVFAIQDPTLPLTSYKQELEELKVRLHSAQNCLPFQKAAEKASEKAAMLFRQCLRDSLYDRISTRPFLKNIEKRWIAFQILTAVDQAHKSGVCHGDIKTENVMVTSWNWVLLTDFASFKPTYLPEDSPADFNYFFDTSRRRTCYIAPECFVDGGLFATEVRAEALRTLTKVLALVKEVPCNDINIYPEYILPGIAHLAQDDATVVRLAYAVVISVNEVKLVEASVGEGSENIERNEGTEMTF